MANFQGTKPNEVWRLKSRRLGIIIDNPRDNNNQLLWMDEVTGELSITDIFNRLDYLTSIGADEVMLEWFDELRENKVK